MANNRRKKRRMKKRKKVLLFVLEILVLAVLLVVLYFTNILNKIDFQNMTDNEAGINDDLSSETAFAMEGYTNIALFGLDNRGSGDYDTGNSDAILIASINNENKEVRLVSVYRDTYLSVGDGKYYKCNSAYERGGAKQAVQMLNSNLDLDIKDYVSVDWGALVETIDDLGGIDIEVTDEEVDKINEYTVEIVMMTGKETTPLTESGLVHLDGTQATSYARIRKLAGDDYMRTARQRIVLQAMLEKAQKADIGTLNKVCNDVVDDISTTLTLKQMLILAKDVGAYKLVETTGFPFELTTASLDSGDTVVPVELENNVSELHQWLFNDEDYSPSQTVQSISANIVKKSGVTLSNADVVNTTNYNNTVDRNGTAVKKEDEGE
ncbi:LytR family transcriptional regulator [Roseburia sp. MUC/MUC-530-WT-4D]|uniref:LytR family transcriptional regulator n=1 Tax=Roseburia porci TaxID=2605790 RepID=A0A6L5YRZ7_9FIRM|nr:LCP family protein [Roseburia porci]MDD6742669.1 LCP family protein [Roseburia porci]MST75088.1 LytR family transcriptional regulator [Roseburia porci]